MRTAQRVLGLALLAAVGFAPAARAQVASTGNIYGTVKDESGAVLPGATASLTGAFGTRSTTSGTNGDFRFVNVDHGTHQLRVALTGFTGVTRSVTVVTGQNLELGFTLKVASVEERVTVTGDTPVVDTKRVGTATTISKDELVQIPSSRDPWALMRTVPGVIVDRVNVAGSESGQQSNFFSKGADGKDSVWSLDGVIITDMAAIGASPGVVFRQAHAHNVVTLPSHANILSGRLPFQHGVRDNAGFRFPADTETLATRLKAAGYRTGAFVSAFTLDSRFGLDRGFDVYDDQLDGAAGPLALPERHGADTVARAQRWLAQGDGRPTFCWIHLYDPHAPYRPREPFAARYAATPYVGEVAAADAALEPVLVRSSRPPRRARSSC